MTPRIHIVVWLIKAWTLDARGDITVVGEQSKGICNHQSSLFSAAGPSEEWNQINYTRRLLPDKGLACGRGRQLPFGVSGNGSRVH